MHDDDRDPIIYIPLPAIRFVDAPPTAEHLHKSSAQRLYCVAATWRKVMANIIGRLAAMTGLEDTPILYLHWDGKIAEDSLIGWARGFGDEHLPHRERDGGKLLSPLTPALWQSDLMRSARQTGQWYWNFLYFERRTYDATPEVLTAFEEAWTRMHTPRLPSPDAG